MLEVWWPFYPFEGVRENCLNVISWQTDAPFSKRCLRRATETKLPGFKDSSALRKRVNQKGSDLIFLGILGCCFTLLWKRGSLQPSVFQRGADRTEPVRSLSPEPSGNWVCTWLPMRQSLMLRSWLLAWPLWLCMDGRSNVAVQTWWWPPGAVLWL